MTLNRFAILGLALLLSAPRVHAQCSPPVTIPSSNNVDSSGDVLVWPSHDTASFMVRIPMPPEDCKLWVIVAGGDGVDPGTAVIQPTAAVVKVELDFDSLPAGDYTATFCVIPNSTLEPL